MTTQRFDDITGSIQSFLPLSIGGGCKSILMVLTEHAARKNSDLDYLKNATSMSLRRYGPRLRVQRTLMAKVFLHVGAPPFPLRGGVVLAPESEQVGSVRATPRPVK